MTFITLVLILYTPIGEYASAVERNFGNSFRSTFARYAASSIAAQVAGHGELVATRHAVFSLNIDILELGQEHYKQEVSSLLLKTTHVE